MPEANGMLVDSRRTADRNDCPKVVRQDKFRQTMVDFDSLAAVEIQTDSWAASAVAPSIDPAVDPTAVHREASLDLPYQVDWAGADWAGVDWAGVEQAMVAEEKSQGKNL